MNTVTITKTINNCHQCENCISTMHFIEHTSLEVFDLYCNKSNDKKITSNYVKDNNADLIPDWCPLLNK